VTAEGYTVDFAGHESSAEHESSVASRLATSINSEFRDSSCNAAIVCDAIFPQNHAAYPWDI
jgi:hypothetical protein